MPEIVFREALKRGLEEALENDPRVFMMGEDIGAYGGAYAVTDGFLKKFGPERIKDTPISEQAFIGAGIGAVDFVLTRGLRPDRQHGLEPALHVGGTDQRPDGHPSANWCRRPAWGHPFA